MGFKLFPYQEAALGKLKSGSVLFGEIGSGKTFTGLAFYLKQYSHKKLYVITTAKKRDTGDWEDEAEIIGVNDIHVDSWNNIHKYTDVKNAFFIFDEQRAIGYGKWAKSLIKISKRNDWIMLTGTPGDVWMDYLTVFIANGFYKHKTDFVNKHVEYNPFVTFPQIKKYHNEGKLMKHRNSILVPMKAGRTTKKKKTYVESNYNKDQYERVAKDRWNVFDDKPIESVPELMYTLRKLVASHHDRMWKAKWLMSVHSKAIVFYNYNYELDILKDICEELNKTYAEWNGQRHEVIPDTDEWVYLVQYTAGAEGWNCIETNVIIFYSINYSYRLMAQAEGRVDRINTEFETLEYFYLTSKAPVDKAVRRTVENKKKFNENAWAKRSGYDFRTGLSK